MGRKMNTINGVLESIGNLGIEEQAYVLEILSMRLVEQRRIKIAKRAIESEDTYRRGKAKVGTFKDLWKDLND